MEKVNWKQLSMRRGLGIAVIILGVIVLFMPLFIGVWVIGLLGLALIVAGLFQLVQLLRSRDEVTTWIAYIGGVITMLLGGLMFLAPDMALSAVLIVLTLAVLFDGGTKIYAGYHQSGADRKWSIFNGVVSIGLAFLIWFFVSANLGLVAIGVVLGLRLMVEGWTMFFMPEKGYEKENAEPDLRVHPDAKLALDPHDDIKEMRESLIQSEKTETLDNILYCASILAIFFIIHYFRVDANWSFIGMITPVTATIGDVLMSLIIGIAIILPLRLLWRKFTRPLERTSWNRYHNLRQKGSELTYPEQGLTYWLERRMRLALTLKQTRYSLNSAFWWLMRIGIPITAIIIAINSIWGFSWYFNSENWSSGVYQALAKTRVDPWRQTAAIAVEQDTMAKGTPQEKVFAVETENEAVPGDFSFIVIGDTGEGDISQYVLHDQITGAGKREEVKFLVLSSDVIYPDGKMRDYENNFYVPFKGFGKPIYAIPGNHDWFDANDGFNANFLEHDAAMLTLQARLKEDSQNLVSANERFEEMTAEGKRLREYYRVSNGHQRAPFFEIHRAGFSLIAADTGILRQFDDKQREWFEAALQRAGTNFKMVILGHPFYVAGVDSADGSPNFSVLHDLLRRYEVEVMMAGDTHDFEFYKEKYSTERGPKEMLHFVNGGGGAYLSLGTAIAFPENPVTLDNAFYPRTDELRAKLYAQTPPLKMPFLWWMDLLGGWPFSSEFVSGAFNVNQSPFFQSFMQINVEPSKNQVRLQLYGINGPLLWKNIQVNGDVKPADKTDDDPVEWIVPMQSGSVQP